MSKSNENSEQRPGDEKPQAPRSKTVASVDDGNKPLNPGGEPHGPKRPVN
jgi:hypothetical protein